MNEQTQIPETNEPTTSNPTETTTPSTEPTTDWKEPIMQRTSLEPFATKAENKDDYIANLENGYENLSSKMGAKKEALLGDIPKEASGYELEGEGIDWYKDLAHQSNLTKDQAKAVQENFNTYMEEQSKVRETEFTDGLKQKWGDDFEGNFDKAKEFMADNLSKEEAKKLEGLDNVSLTLLTEVAISLRDKYQDNSSLPAGSDTGTSALANLVKERDEIMQSDIYRSGGLGRNSVAFATKQNELLALTDKIHKIKTGS